LDGSKLVFFDDNDKIYNINLNRFSNLGHPVAFLANLNIGGRKLCWCPVTDARKWSKDCYNI